MQLLAVQLACAALLAAMVAGCSPGEAGDGNGAGDLEVYVSVPLQGPAGVHGRAIRDGAELALHERLGDGGPPAKPGAHFLDDTRGARWSPAVVGEDARRATSDSTAIAYVGDFESGATRTSLPITNEARMLQVSPASTALDLVSPFPGSDEVPELVQPSGERSFGRVIPDDEAQAAAGAAWARKLGAPRVATVTDGSEFGDTVAEEFAEEAQGLGISVERPRGATELRAVGSNPHLVYYGGTAEGALPLLTRAAREAPSATLMGTDALLLDPTFMREAGAIEPRLLLTAAAQDPAQLPPPEGPRFVRRYRREYGGKPDPYAAYGYEAIALLLDSIERAGGGADRPAVIDAFLGTTDRRSVLGTYSIDEVGNTTLDRIAGYRVRDGRPVFDSALRVP